MLGLFGDTIQRCNQPGYAVGNFLQRYNQLLYTAYPCHQHILVGVKGSYGLVQQSLLLLQLLLAALQLLLGGIKLFPAVHYHVHAHGVAPHGGGVGGKVGTVLGGLLIVLVLQPLQLLIGFVIAYGIFQLGVHFLILVKLILNTLAIFKAFLQRSVGLTEAKSAIYKHKAAQQRKHNGKYSGKSRVLHIQFLPIFILSWYYNSHL